MNVCTCTCIRDGSLFVIFFKSTYKLLERQNKSKQCKIRPITRTNSEIHSKLIDDHHLL